MTRGRRLLGRFNLLLAAVLALAVWVAVTSLATRPAFKWLVDLTPQAQFSVSPETERLLRELSEKDATVRIDTFYARLPAPRTPAESYYVGIQQRIQELTTDLLVRYAELGGDRVEVAHFNPYGDVAATRAQVEEIGGLRQENVLVVSIGKRHKELSLSLDLAEIDFPQARQQVAPGARQSYPTLKLFKGEEAISMAIASLLVEGTPRLYFLDGYDFTSLTAGVADSYSEFVAALKSEGFEIGIWNVEKEGRVPEDAAALAVLEPRREISEASAAVLFRWLQQGGRLLVNLSWSEHDGWNPTWGELGALCGFRFGTDRVCHLVPDPAHPERPGIGGVGAATVVAAGLAPHPITRPLEATGRYPQLKFVREIYSAGPATPAGVAFDPVLRTGPWAWLAPRDPSTDGVVYDPPGNREAYASRTVGAVVDITSESGKRPGAVMLLSGMAFINGGGMNVNGDLGLNIINWFAERTELVTIRGNRYRSARIELAPQQAERSATLVRTIAPGALFVLGLVVLVIRRRR